MTVDATSKAARVTLYNSAGVEMANKATYRAATTTILVPVATANVPFFIIAGSVTKTVRVQRIQISGWTQTAVGYIHVNLGKYSTNATGGTSTVLVATPLDSNFAAATATSLRAYTAAPTAGTKVGDIASRRALSQVQATPAAGGPLVDTLFDFQMGFENYAPVLRGTAQELGVYFPTAAASANNIALAVEWTEE